MVQFVVRFLTSSNERVRGRELASAYYTDMRTTLEPTQSVGLEATHHTLCMHLFKKESRRICGEFIKERIFQPGCGSRCEGRTELEREVEELSELMRTENTVARLITVLL